MSHFAQRCRERGITETDPDMIHSEIKAAVNSGDDNKAEYVMEAPRTGAPIYRFKVREGIFYAVVAADGTPKTVLTQEMIRKKKWARKKSKKQGERA